MNLAYQAVLIEFGVRDYRSVARLIEGGVHVKNMRASGHTTYNLMRFKLSMLYLHHTRLVGG